MAHHDSLLKGLGWLRREAMPRPLLRPIAHFTLDDAGVDPIPPWLQDFLGNLLHQPAVPLAATPLDGWTLGQTTTPNFQRGGKCQSPWIEVLSSSRFLH